MMRALSMLPLPLLYAAFGVAAWFLRIVGWRRRLVMDALERCLPGLGPPERQLILRAYYRYLGELTAEVLHVGQISREDLEQRQHIENPEMVQHVNRRPFGCVQAAARPLHLGANADMGLAFEELARWT